MMPYKLFQPNKKPTVGEQINEDLHKIAESKAQLDELLKEEVVDTPKEEDKDKAMALYTLTAQLDECSTDDLRQVFGEMRLSTLNRVQTVLDDLRDVDNQS